MHINKPNKEKAQTIVCTIIILPKRLLLISFFHNSKIKVTIFQIELWSSLIIPFQGISLLYDYCFEALTQIKNLSGWISIQTETNPKGCQTDS
jgi:hypothetical protein